MARKIWFVNNVGSDAWWTKTHQIREKRLARLQQSSALAGPSDPATSARTTLPASTEIQADKQPDSTSLIPAIEPSRATPVRKETKSLSSNQRSVTSFEQHVLHQVLHVTFEVRGFPQGCVCAALLHIISRSAFRHRWGWSI